MSKWKGPYLAFSAAILAANVVVYVFKPGGDAVLAWASDLLPVACSLVAAACLGLAAASFKTPDAVKAAWSLIFAGIALDFIAECIYAFIELVLGREPSFPGPADVAWLAAYPFIIAFIAIILAGYVRSGLPLGSWKRYAALAAAVVAVGAAVTAWALVPILSDGETGALEKFVSAFYPIADFIVLIPAAALILITLQFGSGSVVAPWLLITLGFIGWCVSDLLYSVLSYQGLYDSGNFIDLGWNASYLLFGAAGLAQRSLVKSI